MKKLPKISPDYSSKINNGGHVTMDDVKDVVIMPR